MELTQEHTMLQNTLRKFGQKELLDKAGDIDQKAQFPTAAISKLAELGIMGGAVPEQFEGTALDMTSMVIGLEELSQVCGSTSLVVAIHNLFVGHPLVEFGTVPLKTKYLPKLAFGEILGGFGEPVLTNVTATGDGDNLRLSGECKNIICGQVQGLYLVFVRNDPAGGALTALVVEGNTSGMKILGPADAIGMRGAGMCAVQFDNVVVSKAQILGTEGAGHKVYEAICDRARIGLAAIALGLAQASIDASLKYARTRVQFGQPIINFGMVQSKLAEMTTRVKAARLLTYSAAEKHDQNKPIAADAAIARYFTARTAVLNTTDAIQLHGGYGYTKDYPAERFFRDCQICEVLCGAPYQDREFIARKLFG